DVILARYREDHGLDAESPIDEKIRARLANLKSVLRKKYKIGRRRKKRRDVAVAAPAVSPAETFKSQMELLEEQIDDCLTFAKRLTSVIHALRLARREVVWKLGD